MNKYIKLAIEKKLEDNGIKPYDKFKVDGWIGDFYYYNGDNIWANQQGDNQHVSMENPYNFSDFINLEITKLDEYKQIDFETAYKIMSNGDVVYLKNFKGESIVELRIATSSDGLEYISSKPWYGGNIKFSDLCDYEFYVKE